MPPRKSKLRKGKKRPIRSRPRTVSLAVKKYVKRTIHSQIENKSVQINGGYGFGNVLEGPDLNAYPMCPLNGYWSIPQGTGAGGRIGNQIKTRKCYLSYVLRPLPYDAISNAFVRPMEVQMMLGYVKNTPSIIPSSFDVNQIFQSGSSVAAPVGTLRDLIATVNSDYWVVKKKWIHKLGFANNAGTGANGNAQSYANNDFKLNVVKRIDITKFVPSTYQFNDNSITPTSKNLFFMFQAVSAGGDLFTATQLPANIEFWIDFHYEDA